MGRISISVCHAEAADAEEIAVLLRRSITELCEPDHGNNPRKLEPWLANKTADTVRRWIEGPDHIVCAVNEDGEGHRIVGVGLVASSGEVQLNYVHPDARNCGVSKAVMRSLEAHLRAHGHAKASLTSTRTADRFYRAIGYVETGEASSHRGMQVRRFEKLLVAE